MSSLLRWENLREGVAGPISRQKNNQIPSLEVQISRKNNKSAEAKKEVAIYNQRRKRSGGKP